MALTIGLPPGVAAEVHHLVGNYPPFMLGVYEYEGSRLRFAYEGCKWKDDETWKECGECRAGLWSGGRVDCGVGGSRVSSVCLFVFCCYLLLLLVWFGLLEWCADEMVCRSRRWIVRLYWGMRMSTLLGRRVLKWSDMDQKRRFAEAVKVVSSMVLSVHDGHGILGRYRFRQAYVSWAAGS